MLGSLRIVTPATGQIITTTQLIQQARIDDAADSNLNLYISAATGLIEKYLDRSLRTQTLSWTLTHTEPPNDGYPAFWGYTPIVLPIGFEYILMMRGQQAIELPRSPVTAIVSVVITDWQGNTQALTLNTDYEVQLLTDPARVRLRNNGIGSTNYNPYHDMITITYTCGYTVVPDEIIYAVLLQTAHMYRFRGDNNEAGPSLTYEVKRTLDPFRLISFGGG
jgi:Phage gp6-like head-tail connector protein